MRASLVRPQGLILAHYLLAVISRSNEDQYYF